MWPLPATTNGVFNFSASCRAASEFRTSVAKFFKCVCKFLWLMRRMHGATVFSDRRGLEREAQREDNINFDIAEGNGTWGMNLGEARVSSHVTESESVRDKPDKPAATSPRMPGKLSRPEDD